MAKVNFGYSARGGCTIYRYCFDKYIDSRYTLKRPEKEWSKLVERTEAVFFFLVEHGYRNGFNIDAILEIPDSTGQTCFTMASLCSEKICSFIIKRRIKINSITTTLMVAEFKYPDLAVQMLKKNINPHVIDCKGYSQVDLHPSSFESAEAKRLLCESPRSVNMRSIHYSIEDIDCSEKCAVDCSSKFKKFYYKNGSLVEMTDENRIGSGGFGMVFKQLFHGKQMAMKCIYIGEIEQRPGSNKAESDLEHNISEIRIQIATIGSGIMVPEAFVRQQNQDQDEDGKWIATNYNIFIYPLYDCNLYELHENNYDQFTEEILSHIIHQCLTRKKSNQ